MEARPVGKCTSYYASAGLVDELSHKLVKSGDQFDNPLAFLTRNILLIPVSMEFKNMEPVHVLKQLQLQWLKNNILCKEQ